LIDVNLERLLSRVTGSVFPNLNGPDLKTFRILVPPQELVSSFEERAAQLLGLVWSNVQENNTLVALRDSLLPKLLSGEIRVKEAEHLAETSS
jgi:type I restriction enzyme S subunit